MYRPHSCSAPLLEFLWAPFHSLRYIVLLKTSASQANMLVDKHIVLAVSSVPGGLQAAPAVSESLAEE